MPTQEERLATLEKVQSTMVRAIHDLNHHITMVEGIQTRQELDIRDIKNTLRTMDKRLILFEQNTIDRFDAHDSRFDAHDKRFDAHDSRFDAYDKRFDAHDKRFDVLEGKLDQVILLLTSLANKPEPEM